VWVVWGEKVQSVVPADDDPASPLHHEPCGYDATVIGHIGHDPSLASHGGSGVASDVLAEDVGLVVADLDEYGLVRVGEVHPDALVGVCLHDRGADIPLQLHAGVGMGALSLLALMVKDSPSPMIFLEYSATNLQISSLSEDVVSAYHQYPLYGLYISFIY